MKTISANFEIIDNTGNNYSSNVTINNPYTNNIMAEIKNKIMKVYNITIEQILSISNIDVK